MESSRPQVAVVGLGAIGSMTLLALARRGVDVTGYEQFAIGNNNGASGGETRMFRTSYVEGPDYIPLILQARELWEQLEKETGSALFYPSGHLTLGHPDSALVRKVLHAADVNGLEYSTWRPGEAMERYPQVRVPEEYVAVFDPLGGLLRTHHSIVAATRRAQELGASVHPWTEVTEVASGQDGPRLLADGEWRSYDHVLLCTGPWVTAMLPELPIEVGRTEQSWFAVTGEFDYSPHVMPPILRGRPPDYSGGEKAYDATKGSMPAPDGASVKFGLIRFPFPEGRTEITGFDRSVRAENSRALETSVTECLNGVYPAVIRSDAFFEGFTIDNDPVVGPVDRMPGVSVLGGFSGHGFKLAPYFGELGADLATGREIGEMPTRLFSPRRFGASPA